MVLSLVDMHTWLIGCNRLQCRIEGSTWLLGLPLGGSLAGPRGPALPLMGLVPLPALLLPLQQAGTLLKDLVLKGANHANEVLHMFQVNLSVHDAIVFTALMLQRLSRGVGCMLCMQAKTMNGEADTKQVGLMPHSFCAHVVERPSTCMLARRHENIEGAA